MEASSALEQPVLETERLVLSPFRAEDAADVFAYASDPQVCRFVNWDAHRTLADTEAYFSWIERSTRAERGRLSFVWALRLREHASETSARPGGASEGHLPRVIGSIDFRQGPFPHRARVDYVVARRHWGRGFATEAVRAVIRWGFGAMPELLRFETYCLAENRASARVLEKAGLSLECVREKFLAHRGEIKDTAHYALVR